MRNNKSALINGKTLDTTKEEHDKSPNDIEYYEEIRREILQERKEAFDALAKY